MLAAKYNKDTLNTGIIYVDANTRSLYHRVILSHNATENKVHYAQIYIS